MEIKTPKLNKLGLFFVILVLMNFIISCSNTISNQPATEEGFSEIENALKNKFGKGAYYTDLTITHNKFIGNIIGVTVTVDPESHKMGQWNLTQDTWQQNSDITLEVPEGTKAAGYMFQLGETVDLAQLGRLIEQSVEKLKVEKLLENPTLSIAGLNFPDNGNISEAKYTINLQSENGGTTFSFLYSLSGDLIEMTY